MHCRRIRALCGGVKQHGNQRSDHHNRSPRAPRTALKYTICGKRRLAEETNKRQRSSTQNPAPLSPSPGLLLPKTSNRLAEEIADKPKRLFAQVTAQPRQVTRPKQTSDTITHH
jgi:hypothetical protein